MLMYFKRLKKSVFKRMDLLIAVYLEKNSLK